ncbi:MAG TPA: cobalamin-binding protein [Dehalococcoidia bacterium]|nr:cobalamin-binding protein [Dehalococcoidia bacterium]
MNVRDALGRDVAVDTQPQRIVSLVPSITEALFAYGAGDRVVGLTDFCVEPAARVADKPKVGGTKKLDLPFIEQLRPDLVIASAEENEKEQVESLIAAGLTVFVTLPRTVDEAIKMLADVARLTGTTSVAMPKLTNTSRILAQVKRENEGQAGVRFFCPIWRRPYMSVGHGTYMDDLLKTCGGLNIFARAEGHYPEVTLDEAARRDPEVVLLPDEPYPFAEKHVAEVREALAATTAVRDDHVHLVDGKMLSWYGPRIAGALVEVSRIFAAAAPT